MNTQTVQCNTQKQVNLDKLSNLSKIKGKFDVVFDNLDGKILNKRYKVQKFLDNGQNGEVYEVTDIKKDGRPLVIKVQETTDLFLEEINSMIKVQRKCKSNGGNTAKANGRTPEIKDYGQFILIDSANVQKDAATLDLTDDNAVIFSYMVMPRYGMTLHDLFESRKGLLSAASIYSLGIQMINILEQIHQAGFVFNDLKLDNLLFDMDADAKKLRTTEENIFDKNNINIIDFGFVCPYVDQDTQEHLEKTQLDIFRGNMVFSSINQLKFHSTSRRDDLISLFYLLVYLFKRGNLPGTTVPADTDVNDEFKIIRDAKINQSTKDVCFGNTKDLTSFKREVFGYRFKDEPKYEHLRQMLRELRDKETAKAQARALEGTSLQSRLEICI